MQRIPTINTQPPIVSEAGQLEAMDFSNIKTQKDYFYSGPWTRKLDGLFLSHIHNHLVDCEVVGEEEIKKAVCFAMLDLTSTHSIEVDVEDAWTRYKHLKERYEAWTLLLRDPDTYWDVDAGVVHASKATWLRLFEQNNMVKAYFDQVEPHYGKLALVFAFNKPKEGSEEVNSPANAAKRRTLKDQQDFPGEVSGSNSVPEGRTPQKPTATKPGSSSSTSSGLVMWWKP